MINRGTQHSSSCILSLPKYSMYVTNHQSSPILSMIQEDIMGTLIVCMC